MARTYTYEDFERALVASGLGDQFSDSDLALAQKNPDAGMSILSYKQDYQNATTDEMRALANAGAESVRSSFGEYTGGGAGTGYKVTQMSPGGFEYDEPAPEYKNTYGGQVDDLMAEIIKQEKFTYDPTTDPLYSQYKKTYTREGKRATADALWEAASMTGGIPSSYAVSAASQAGNYYASQLADKVPELYDMAYSKYLDEYNKKLDHLEMLRDREQFEYDRYLDEVSRHESEKNFDYGKWLDEIESQANERSEAFAKAEAAAEYGDYTLLEALGVTPDYALLEQMRSEKTATGTPAVTGEPEVDRIFEEVNAKYPDGVITDQGVWDMLVSQYGEAELEAAGYQNGVVPAITDETATAMQEDITAMIRLFEIGDADIKSPEDVRAAMMDLYPEYREDPTFIAWINEVLAALNEKAEEKTPEETSEEIAQKNEGKKRLESGKIALNWKER